MKILGLKEVQALLGCSRGMATYILSQKDCPTLKRSKGQAYKIFDEDLIGYIQRKDWRK